MKITKNANETLFDFTDGQQGKVETFPEMDGPVRGRDDRAAIRSMVIDLMFDSPTRVLGVYRAYQKIFRNLFTPHERVAYSYLFSTGEYNDR